MKESGEEVRTEDSGAGGKGAGLVIFQIIPEL